MSGEAAENRAKEESDNLNVPSECKIAKTELDSPKPPDNETNSVDNELIQIKVIYNKKKYDVSTSPNDTIAQLKTQLKDLIGSSVHSSIQNIIQKLLFQEFLKQCKN